MEKITNEECIPLFKEKFPKFIPYWKAYINEWGADEGLHMQMIAVGDFAIEIIKSNNEEEIKNIFNLIELLLVNGDEFVQSAIATGLLEYLLSKDPDEIKLSKFVKYWGENTFEYCKAWDRFTGVKTEGLWDDDYKWDLSKKDLNKMLRILDEIKFYKEGKVSLNDLLSALENLLKKFDLVDNRWINDFNKDFNLLKHRTNINGFGSVFVLEEEIKNSKEKKIVENMKNMVNDLILEYLKHTDASVKKSAILGHSTYLVCSNCHEKWNSNLKTAMVICPICETVLHNPLSLSQ